MVNKQTPAESQKEIYQPIFLQGPPQNQNAETIILTHKILKVVIVDPWIVVENNKSKLDLYYSFSTRFPYKHLIQDKTYRLMSSERDLWRMRKVCIFPGYSRSNKLKNSRISNKGACK